MTFDIICHPAAQRRDLLFAESDNQQPWKPLSYRSAAEGSAVRPSRQPTAQKNSCHPATQRRDLLFAKPDNKQRLQTLVIPQRSEGICFLPVAAPALPIGCQILPGRISVRDQSNLLRTVPVLQILFTRNRVPYILKPLHMHQTVNLVPRGEGAWNAFAMLRHPRP